jgi:hypothetical protein
VVLKRQNISRQGAKTQRRKENKVTTLAVLCALAEVSGISMEITMASLLNSVI